MVIYEDDLIHIKTPNHVTSPKTQAQEMPSFLYKPNRHKELIAWNQDYTGWIRIPGTNIDYPFVKARDNDYYLKRDFQGRYDEKGTIYMDHRNIGFDFSNHVILYGHNMKDGSMFGELDMFKNHDFALSNNFIVIDDIYGTRYFQIYASYFDEADPSIIQTQIPGDDMEAFIALQIQKSAVDYRTLPTSDDKLITLVTCSYEVDDGRFFLHGKEIDYVPHP
jgi:sortase B